MSAVETQQWQSVADDGTTSLVLIQHKDGLVQVTDELLTDLLKRSGVRTIPAGRSPEMPGINFLRLRDMGHLLSGAGMRKLS